MSYEVNRDFCCIDLVMGFSGSKTRFVVEFITMSLIHKIVDMTVEDFTIYKSNEMQSGCFCNLFTDQCLSIKFYLARKPCLRVHLQ